MNSYRTKLIEDFVREFRASVVGNRFDFLTYRRVYRDHVGETLEAAMSAAEQVPVTVWADLVPVDYVGSPVSGRPGMEIIRIGDTPRPWS